MNSIIDTASQSNLFKKLFYQSPNPMAVTRHDNGVCLEVNEAFKQYFGKHRRQVIGKSMLELGLVTPEDTLDLYNKIEEKKCVQNVPVRVSAINHEVRCLLISIRIIRSGNHILRLSVGTDVPVFHLKKKSFRADLLSRTFDTISEAGIVLIRGFEKKKPSVYYMNGEANKFFEKHPLNNLLPDLKEKGSVFVKASSKHYHVRVVPGHNDAPLKLIVIERFPDTLLIKEKLKEYDLSARRREIALLSCTGHSNREIAMKLNISEYTVKDHIKEIFDVVGVRNRSELFPKLVNLR